MSTDIPQLASYIGDIARQMANMADHPSLNVIRYLLYQIVEGASNWTGPGAAKDPARYTSPLSPELRRVIAIEATHGGEPSFSRNGFASVFCRSSA